MVGLNDDQKVGQDLKPIANSLWGYFIHNRRMAVMIGLIFFIVGAYSFVQMPRESFPEIKNPRALVITAYPGASSVEVAEQVTSKIEQKIKNIETLKLVTSSSSEGSSQISVQFEANADLKESINKLKDAVDDAKVDLPIDATDPVIQELTFSDAPIVTYSFFGDLPYEQLLEVAKKIQDEFETVKGVESANISGEREKNVLISVRQEDMIQYGLSLRAISQAIKSFNLINPIGNIEIDGLVYRVSINAEQEAIEQLKTIPLAEHGGALIYLEDVADVQETFAEEKSRSRVSVNGEPSSPGFSISIIKKNGANVIETGKEVESILVSAYENKLLPDTVKYIEFNNLAKENEKQFNDFMLNSLQTIVLIFVILFFALGIKEALIGGISVPLTFLISFTFLFLTGNTFNLIVFFSLILGLGLLVDTAIVMMEGIHEYLYKEKLSPLNAALKAVKTYRFPLLSGMLTTVAAFTPMLLVSGVTGQFFKYIPITVDVVLISAFIIGLFIIPAYAVILMKKKGDNLKENDNAKSSDIKRENLLSKFNKRYTSFLNHLLSKRSRRVSMWVITIVSFSLAMTLPSLGLIKMEAFPPAESPSMLLNVEAPIGFTFEKIEPVIQQIEAVIQNDPDIESYVVNLGARGSQNFEDITNSSGSHLANFILNFVDEKSLSKPSFVLASEYAQKLAFITNAKIEVPPLNSGPTSGSAIEVVVFGDDYGVLQKISSDLQSHLNQIGASQTDDNLFSSTAEFAFDFTNSYTKAVLKSQGLSVLDVAQEVRMAVFPTKVISLKQGEDDIDVNIQQKWTGYKPHSLGEVNEIMIQNNRGDYIKLGQLAKPDASANLNSVNHYDAQRAITVSADIAKNFESADVVANLNDFLASYAWPEGYSYKLAGGNEENDQSIRDLMNSMIIGIILIFLILVAQFNSFKQPFVILLSLPLALIGVFIGFSIFQIKLSVPAVIGIVALSGIVINDAIVLIDRINENRRTGGMGLKEAILEAGPARLQPILITSVTTVLGILPISLTDSFWLSLGMAIVFGMIFSTILTLVIIPIFYYSTELKYEKKRLDALKVEEVNHTEFFSG